MVIPATVPPVTVLSMHLSRCLEVWTLGTMIGGGSLAGA